MPPHNFATTTHAKWILAGEHSVLRGKSALVFPLKSKLFKLQYYQNTNIETEIEDSLTKIFRETIQFGMQMLGTDNIPTGKFGFENHIPIAANLGFSAALCVAVARWFAWQKLIDTPAIFAFAQRLENKFHHTSSGVDIAGVMSESGICYKIDNAFEYLQLRWQPKIYLSDSGADKTTKNCIEVVNELRKKSKALGDQIDDAMENSVELAQKALASEQDLEQLTTAINQANNCFHQWGIVSDVLAQHLQQLLAAGALAVKPTGSGTGGYALSLWDKQPPASLPFTLIAGF